MDLLKFFSNKIGTIAETNKKRAQINRLKVLIKNGQDKLDYSYKRLGKILYQNLDRTDLKDNDEVKVLIEKIESHKRVTEKARKLIETISDSSKDDRENLFFNNFFCCTSNQKNSLDFGDKKFSYRVLKGYEEDQDRAGKAFTDK